MDHVATITELRVVSSQTRHIVCETKKRDHRGMRITHLLLLSVALGSLPIFANAQDDLSMADADALAKTQALLTNPSARPQNSEEDKKISALGGTPENTEAIYQLSSSIFADLTKDNGGDSTQMLEKLAQAQRDPAAFAQSLSAKNQQTLHDIAAKSPANTASQNATGK
jgi:hypothetical protein